MTTRVPFPFLIILLLCVNKVAAQPKWERVSGVAPCTVISFAFLPAEGNSPPMMFAGTAGSGLFRSGDLGESWTPLDTLFLHSNWAKVLAVGTDIFALCSNGLFHSTDRGATWADLVNGRTANSFATSDSGSASAPIWLVGTDPGILISTDLGSSWTARRNILMGSDDAGVPEPKGINHVRIHRSDMGAGDLVFYAISGNWRLESRDSGRNWSETRDGSLRGDLAVLFPSDGSDRILTASWHGIQRSTDMGRHWTTLLPRSALALASTADRNGEILYAATDSVGVFESTDQGTTWVGYSRDLDGIQICAITVCPDNSDILFAGSKNGCYRSTDGGKHWTSMNRGMSAGFIGSLATVAGGDGRGQLLFVGSGRGLKVSRDAGASWTSVDIGLTMKDIGAISVHPSKPTLYAVAWRKGMIRSTDAGASWSARDPGGLAGFPMSLAVCEVPESSEDLLIAGISNKGTFRSTDGGDSWVLSDSGLVPQLSTNGCNTSRLPREKPRMWSYTVAKEHPSTIFAGTDQGVFLSTNLGLNWKAMNNGLNARMVSTLTSVTDSTTYLLAGTRDGVFRSATKVDSWTPIHDGIPTVEIHALVLFEGNGRKHLIFAGTDEGVYSSSDAGLSWSFVEGGLPQIPVENLAILPAAADGSCGAYLIAGTHEKGIWRLAIE